MSDWRHVFIPLLFIVASHPVTAAMPWICVSQDGHGFEFVSSGRKFVPWGFNYDHDDRGRLLEDYWNEEWPRVESAFGEMRQLGANVVRIHLQFGRFMQSSTEARPEALQRLKQLLRLAESTGLYLDLTGLGCYHKQDVPKWYDALDESERWSAQARFWEAIAQTCEHSPAVFCYDLMNEPVVAGGSGKRDDWLGPGFGDKHFVQFITLQAGDRQRHHVAQQWIRGLTAAIRKHDSRHLITVGLVHWSLDRPGLTSGFIPSHIADELDFLCVHIYPEKDAVDEALDTLKAFAAVGKPVVVEETFPLKCGAQQLGTFMEQGRPFAAGYIGFYWDNTPAELRPAKSIGDAFTISWLELFQQLRTRIVEEPSERMTFLHNGVTAHRGDSGHYPENTIPAFQSAISGGADFIELDVFQTADGQLVVTHDQSTKRVATVDLSVPQSTYEQLRQLDVASEFRQRSGRSTTTVPEERMPLLRDVLLLAMQQSNTRVSIQPKMDCVADIIQLVDELQAGRWVAFNDGSLPLMGKAKQLKPDIPVFWDRPADSDVTQDILVAQEHGFEAMVINAAGITAAKVQQVTAAGLEVGAWTVNDLEQMKHLLQLGVQRIYTDQPAMLLQLMSNHDTR